MKYKDSVVRNVRPHTSVVYDDNPEGINQYTGVGAASKNEEKVSKYVDLHNQAAKEYAQAFKEVGARMWHDDHAHAIKSVELSNLKSAVRDNPKVLSVLEISRPLTRLDSYKNVTPAQRRSLDAKVNAIYKKYYSLARKL